MKRTQAATEAATIARRDRELAEVKHTPLPPVKVALNKEPPKNALLGHVVPQKEATL